MNKTIITKSIDGYDIILGFGSLTIDPEATKKIIDPILSESEEVVAVALLRNEMSKVSSMRIESIKAAREAHNAGNKSLEAQHSYNAELRTEQLGTMNAELIQLIKLVEKKRIDLWNENVVYFEPKSGEILLENETLEETFPMIGENRLLSLDGSVIDDKRGVKYVKDGKICVVTSLGKDPDGPLLEELTSEEFDVLRLAAMTAEEKQAEFDNADDSLASQAASMRSRLEIKDDPEAEEKAKSFYKTGLIDLKKKYGIS